MTEGKHRFDWIIDSSAGQFKSDEANAIYATIHDTAVLHDKISPKDFTTAHQLCRYCRSLAGFQQWAQRVDRALDLYRDIDRIGNSERKPHVMTSPIQIQWYQEWTGPHRWVTCSPSHEEGYAITAHFWVQDQWEQRETKLVMMNDVDSFANDVWEYFQTPDAGTPTSAKSERQ